MLFKIKRRQKEREHPAANKAASFLARGFLKAQTKWAGWLSAKEQKMTLQQKKKAFYVYCIITGVLTIGFFYSAFFVKQVGTEQLLKPPSVTLPKDSRLPDSLNLEYLRELYKQQKAKQFLKDSFTIK